jgi:hypothetical protein
MVERVVNGIRKTKLDSLDYSPESKNLVEKDQEK